MAATQQQQLDEGLLKEANVPDAECPKQEHVLDTPAARTPSKHERLCSLDIQRGLTIAGMIFADEIGAAYPHLNHSPWNNITMADFIMPWFLFMVGTSMAFSLNRFKSSRRARLDGTRTVFIRTLKLFVLGVAIQGGGWPGNYQYGYNLWNLRWCGILQRIAFGYFVVALCELWIPVLSACSSSALTAHAGVFWRHGIKWCIALLFSAVYLALLYGVRVPTWTVEYCGDDNSCHKGTRIECDVRGELTPACAANGYFDRMIFGQQRCGAWMSARSAACSSCSPGRWIYSTGADCAITSRPACVWIGLHYGHVLKHPVDRFQAHSTRILHWCVLSGVLMGLGWGLDAAGHRMNKQLWTCSYVLFMAGSCGGFLLGWYLLVDVPYQERVRGVIRRCCEPLRWMGMNAILVFTLHGLAEAIINSIYWQHDETGEKHNLIGEVRKHVFGHADTCDYCQLFFVLFKIGCFAAGCGYCYRVGYFWKL